MEGVLNESMSSLDKNDYSDSVLYRRFYHQTCKKRKHLKPKCTKVFLMLVYDTPVNYMHLFIQLKPVIHPHQKFGKKRILSEHVKNCDLMAPPEYLAPDPLGGNYYSRVTKAENVKSTLLFANIRFIQKHFAFLSAFCSSGKS